MADLRLQGNDIDVSGGTFHLTSDVNGESTLQKLRIRYQFFLGEWFLDQNQGTPFYETILVKNPSLPTVQAVLGQVALTTPGVATVSNFGFDFDGVTRQLRVFFDGTTDTGQPLSFNTAFIVGATA